MIKIQDVTRSFWKLVLKLMGWRTDVVFPYHHFKKYIVIVGPHTSNWDFIIGLAYRSICHMERTNFLGKKELFGPPVGFIFRWLGGYPVDRTNHHNMVDEVVKIFKTNEEFVIALSPEGTRKKVQKLKTGFYFIAQKVHAPIIMAALDYKNKQAFFSVPFYPSDQKKDFEHILQFYRLIEGKHPENGLIHL